MVKAAIKLFEALAGIALGILATSTLELASHRGLAAHELPRLADHPCRAGTQHAPYLHGDIVTLAGTPYICNGYDGSWRHLPPAAERRLRSLQPTGTPAASF